MTDRGTAAGRARALALIGLATLGSACAGGSTPGSASGDGTAEPAARPSEAPLASGEVADEIENLGYEIADLESAVRAGSVARPESMPVAREALARAGRARLAARDALGAGDTAAAVDSVRAAGARVERVKRSLGLAEEWGEGF